MLPNIHRIAYRFSHRTATIVFDDIPNDGNRWGWFSCGPARMHVLSLDANRLGYSIIYLEDGCGHRSFEPSPDIPSNIARTLEVLVDRERNRIEKAWVLHMIVKDWLKVYQDRRRIVLHAYPGVQNADFVRVIDLVAVYRMQQNSYLNKPVLDPTTAELVIPGRTEASTIRISLDGLLWR